MKVQFKIASALLLAATLANCVPTDTPAHLLSRRDLVGSAKNVENKLRNLENSIQSTLSSVTSSWDGAASSAVDSAESKIESALSQAVAAFDTLYGALEGGCETYNNCDGVRFSFD